MYLKKSSVVFDFDLHTYTLGGKQLSGITGMLSKQLFPDKYDGIPKDIIDEAAKRGTMIHETLGLVEDLGIQSDMPEVKSYLSIKEQNNLIYEYNEYLVSDNEHFASSVDMVYRENDTDFTLVDIKTTYTLDREYVRWQLSIYAYLFEMQNPGAKAVRLAAIWLHGEKHEFAIVDRIPEETVKELLSCEIEGKQFTNPFPVPKATMPEKYLALRNSIREILDNLKYWANKEKELKDGIMKEMVLAGAYSWKDEDMAFTRKKETVRKSFDKESFERDYPGIYEKYVKETPVAGSLIIKLN